MQCDAITITVSFLSGGVAGAFATNFFSKRNARDSRKRNFLAFINVWEAQIAHSSELSQRRTVAGEFDAKRLQLVAQVTELEANYRGKKLSYLKGLIKTITGMAAGQVESDPGYHKLLEEIRYLVAFVKRN